MSLYIIGEAGSCHEQILEKAVELVGVAANAGCSSVKFQYWGSPKRMRDRRHVDTPDAFEVGSISETWFPVLRNVAHDAGMQFLCTAFLPEDVPLVSAYVDAFKVASFENQNDALIKAIAKEAQESKRQVFVSQGLNARPSWKPFMPWSADRPEPVVTFHCVTAYPCPPEEANLGLVKAGQGYSDHTGVVFAGGLAVAAGADYLEVHFRLDDTSPSCPDFPHSLTPTELTRYVEFAETAYRMRGSGVRGAIPCELPNQRYAVAGEEK